MFQDYQQLTEFLERELHWDLMHYDFEDLVFEWSSAELGIRDRFSTKITSIHQLRQLRDSQPWSVFFVDFESKKISIELMRDVLNSLVSIRRTAEAGMANRRRFSSSELLFLCRFGDQSDPKFGIVWFDSSGDCSLAESRTITIAHKDPEPRRRRVLDLMKKHLQWPENTENANHWWKAWQGIFSETVETPEVIQEMEKSIVASYLRHIHDVKEIPEKHIRLLVRQLHQNQQEIGSCLCTLNEALPLYQQIHERLKKSSWDYRRFIDKRRTNDLHYYYRDIDVTYEEILASSKAYQASFDLGISHKNQRPSLCEAHISACNKMALKKTIFADFADEGRIKDVVSGKTKARVDDAMAIARLKVLLANNRKLETLIITGCQAAVENVASKLPKVIGLEVEDLVSEGMIGLLKAIEGYDHEMQTNFHQYSYRIVRNAMEAARDRSRFFVKVVTTSNDRINNSELEKRFVTEDRKISDKFDEFFKDLNISPDMQDRLRMKLNLLIGDHIEFHGKIQSMEKIVCQDLEMRENPDAEKDLTNLIQQITCTIETLPERHKDVLMRRFGLGEYSGRLQSLHEVAAHLQVSWERVRQIEASALRKLRHPARIRMLWQYIE